MAGAAAGAGVACAGSAALVVRDGVLEVRLAGVAGAGWEGALVIPDLDQVAQGVVWLVGVRLVPVVAVERRDRAQVHGQPPAVGQGESPGAGVTRWSRVVVWSE